MLIAPPPPAPTQEARHRAGFQLGRRSRDVRIHTPLDAALSTGSTASSERIVAWRPTPRAVGGGNPLGGGASLARAGQHHDRAAEAAARHPGAVNRRVGLSQRGQRVNLGRRNLVVVAHRRVGRAEQRADRRGDRRRGAPRPRRARAGSRSRCAAPGAPRRPAAGRSPAAPRRRRRAGATRRARTPRRTTRAGAPRSSPPACWCETPESITTSSARAGHGIRSKAMARVSTNSASPGRPRLHLIWSIIPTGAPTKSVSTRCARRAMAWSSIGRSCSAREPAQQARAPRGARRHAAADRYGRRDGAASKPSTSMPWPRRTSRYALDVVDPAFARVLVAEAVGGGVAAERGAERADAAALAAAQPHVRPLRQHGRRRRSRGGNRCVRRWARTRPGACASAWGGAPKARTNASSTPRSDIAAGTVPQPATHPP